jgi:hypothetical protein
LTPTRGGTTATHKPLDNEKRNIPKMGGVCQEAVAMIGMTPERMKEGGKHPTKMRMKKTQSIPKTQMAPPPKAAKTRNPRTKPVSTKGRKMTIHSRQTGDAMT